MEIWLMNETDLRESRFKLGIFPSSSRVKSESSRTIWLREMDFSTELAILPADPCSGVVDKVDLEILTFLNKEIQDNEQHEEN